jgi:hypothetical protein
MKTTVSKSDAVIQAVKAMKKSQFGLTGIKVELEAQLDREDNRCGYCDGDNQVTCDDCNGDGERYCSECDGDGYTLDDNEDRIDCGECDNGTIACDSCEDGYQECDNCDGSSNEWSSESYCHDWIMERLSEHGLAEYREGESIYLDDFSTNWHPVAPLVFGMFYNDHSVDSEFTFTISTEDPNSVFVLPTITNVFKEFAQAVGSRLDTEGAGMHMALLNSEGADYPCSMTQAHNQRFKNFKKSMTLLLPALYFLGSTNEVSRSLSYRRPAVNVDGEEGTKYWAVNYNGALEFRLFETCYDNTEAILDNIVVMRNCMRYWTSRYTDPGMSKVANCVPFGNDDSNHLERLYVTREHIDLLNRGLEKLKPSYYTITELKAERKFRNNKHQINNQVRRVKREAVVEYKEYEERFKWQVRMEKHRRLAHFYEDVPYTDAMRTQPEEQIVAEAERQAEQGISRLEESKQSLDNFINDKLERLNSRSAGRWTLEVA